MHDGSDLSVSQANTKVEIDLELLTNVTPFVLAVDQNMVVIWASRAVLKRVREATGMNAAELIRCRNPQAQVSSQLAPDEIGRICQLSLCRGESEIPLIGRWLTCHNGFLMLASPDVRTTEDLSPFSFDDFAPDDHLMELLTGREETRVSLKEAASAAIALQEKNRELDISRRRLESVNAALENEIAERKQTEEKYRMLFEGALDAIFVADAETGILLDCNPAATELVGREKSELIGKSQTILHPPPENEQDFSETFKEHLKDKQGQTLETQVITKTGQIKEVAIKANLLDIGGRRVLQGISRDITERKRSEERQAQLLEQLAKADQELKDFAHVISHDLKAPLRGVKVLADWLVADYADKLDEEGKEQIRLLTSRVDRMHALIDGVLQYSRITHADRHEQTPIALNDLLVEVVDTVAPPEHIEIVVEDEMPTVACDRTRITQVFQNLISNAVKYMDKPKGWVKIGCTADNDFWKFSIADNGPGIDQRHFDKIFKMFQTLAPRDTCESTGVGLTLVKKIVELYGGEVWVESELAKGSTFLFTLPKQLTETIDEKHREGVAG